jgi:hypothetical protein
MALRRVTVEVPSDVLVQQGVVPRVFFDHNESVEILRVTRSRRANASSSSASSGAARVAPRTNSSQIETGSAVDIT